VGALSLPFFLRFQQLLQHVPVEKAPAVLEDRARELIRRLGPADLPVQSATGFGTDQEYFRRVRETDRSIGRWASLATGDRPSSTSGTGRAHVRWSRAW